MFSTPFVLTFSLILSLSILFLVAPRIFPLRPSVPPIPVSDEIDDLALLRRAAALSNPSAVSHLSSASSTRRPKLKIAFLFLTNTDLHFAPLWERYFGANRDSFNVYIHADPTSNVTDPGGVFHGRFIPAKKTYRASATLISATRRLLATALLDDPANAYFTVLSQYCIPLHSFKYTYASLFYPPPSSADFARLGVRLKLPSYIEIHDKDPRLWKRYVARGRYAMLPDVPFEKFRVGSQFFTLTRRHAMLVIRDRTLWKKFRLQCYRDDECFPEEHYFPTLLSMADLDGCTRYTLTKVNWTGTHNGHPYTYRPAEVSPELIYRLRSSNSTYSYLFARKFSPDCLRPLMGIADSVIFRE